MSAAFVDSEVAELLRGSPDLLAIADAIAATQAPPQAATRPRLIRFGLLAAAVAIAATIALAAPWQGRGSGFVERALAALGPGQVIHVVSVWQVQGTEMLDLGSGTSSQVEARTEIWFDSDRHLERVVSFVGGVEVSEELQTPDGAWTEDGRVYTCAWIAAHPAEATKARVSCNANGNNGTTPRKIPESLPSLDPALGGFVTGYRDALANGSATRDGSGNVDGRPVEWLRFTLVDQGPQGAPVTQRIERVAVDTQTLKPIRVETSVDGATQAATIASIETLAAENVKFTRPLVTPPSQRPVATSVTSQTPTGLDDAAASVGGRLVWPGDAVDGLPFSEATVQQIVTGFGASAGVPFTHSTGVELLYGSPISFDGSTPFVRLRESIRPEMLYGFNEARQAPAEGTMRIESSDVVTAGPRGSATPTGAKIWRGHLVRDGVYVAIDATSRPLLVDAAKELEIR
jgi:hypothetical protein